MPHIFTTYDHHKVTSSGKIFLVPSVAVKYPDKKQLRKEKACSAFNSRLQSITAGKSKQKLKTATSHTRGEKLMCFYLLGLINFFSLTHTGPTCDVMLPTFRVGRPTSTNLIKKKEKSSCVQWHRLLAPAFRIQRQADLWIWTQPGLEQVPGQKKGGGAGGGEEDFHTEMLIDQLDLGNSSLRTASWDYAFIWWPPRPK